MSFFWLRRGPLPHPAAHSTCTPTPNSLQTTTLSRFPPNALIMTSTTASPSSLSRFVQTYAASATNLAGSVYTTARTYVPAFAEPYVQQAEETAVAFTAPYVTVAQDKAEKVLSSLDGQVSWAEG